MTPYYGKSTRETKPELLTSPPLTLESLFEDAATLTAVPKSSPKVVYLSPHERGLPSLRPAWDPERLQRCRRTIRHTNEVELIGSPCMSRTFNSRDPRHLKLAWAEFFNTWSPLAQCIVTFRPHGAGHVERMMQIAGQIEGHINKIVLGSAWGEPRNHHRQVAPLGVIEGDYKTDNLHMHLILFSRTTLMDQDMEELCFQLFRKGLLLEFWFEEAELSEVSGYLRYLLKGRSLSNGLSVYDHIFYSKSLERVRLY